MPDEHDLEHLIATRDAAAFDRVVRAASREQLAAWMAGPSRETLLRLIFENMPRKFDPERAAGVDAVIHWVVRRPGGAEDRYEVGIRDGGCWIDERAPHQPTVVLRIDGVAFLRLIAEATTGLKLLLTRKLQIEGDLLLAARVETFFGREPSAAPEALAVGGA